MTEAQTLVCEHGLRAFELSAWRDGDLSAAEQQRVGDHLAACPAARMQLAEYEAVIAALRAQRVPTVDQRLWRGVAARVAATRAHTPAGLAHRHPLAVTLGTVGTLAALLALVLGFARLLMPGPPSPSAAFRGWTAATFPRGFTLDFGSFAVVDGETAYACVTPLDQQQRQKSTVSGPAAQFWVTRDRGATWTRQADLPILGINQCSVTVDDLNSLVVAVWGRSIPLHSGGLLASTTRAANDSSGGAVSFDGGATWKQPPSLASSISQFATLGNTTYALACCDANGTGNGTRLVVSHDALQNEQPIDGPIVATGQSVTWFTFSPSTDTITAYATDPSASAAEGQRLWQSSDGGASWSKLPTIATSPDVTVIYVAQQSVSGNTPALCAVSLVQSGNFNVPTALECRDADAFGWLSLPLPPRATCTSSTAQPTLQAIAPSGDLYMDDGGCTDTLYRLRAGSNTWQAVATAPTSKLDLAYYPGANVVWTMPRITDAYTQVDPTGYVYAKTLAP